LLSYASEISAGEYSHGPGGQEQPKPISWSRGWWWCLETGSLREMGEQKLSWRNILPNPCTSNEMSRTEMKSFNQLSLPPACVNQQLYKSPG